MNQQSFKAYLDLIQELLSCPRGEEWILLRQHAELVNLELVEVMEQVASYLATEGNTKAAKYLHNWAGKLHHILTDSVSTPPKNSDKTKAYIKLIQDLLSCPEGSEKEVLAANQELLDPELVKVMKQVASQIAAEGDLDTANFLNNLATDLNRTWLKQHEFQPTLKKEIAPDPWLEEDLPSQNSSVVTSKPADAEKVVIEEPKLSASQSQVESDRQLAEHLITIANSLNKLEQTLASRLQPSNPLWYMEILEKAEAAEWILSTDEVEHLIGIRPQCHQEESCFHRGSWTFIKAGKIGAQTGWRVQKQNNLDS